MQTIIQTYTRKVRGEQASQLIGVIFPRRLLRMPDHLIGPPPQPGHWEKKKVAASKKVQQAHALFINFERFQEDLWAWSCGTSRFASQKTKYFLCKKKKSKVLVYAGFVARISHKQKRQSFSFRTGLLVFRTFSWCIANKSKQEVEAQNTPFVQRV